MSEARDIIVKLLSNIGGRKEVEEYLRHYCSVQAQRFAVIAITGAILDEQLDTVASALSFLQEVGLYPIVVHRAEMAIEQALVDALHARRCAARRIAPSALWKSSDIATVTTSELSAAIAQRQLPIVSSRATDAPGPAPASEVEEAAAAVSRAVQPHKVILLTSRGGLLDESGRVIEAVNLSEDYLPLTHDPRTLPETQQALVRAKQLLADLPETTSVSITSADHLAKELFTHRGAGTLLRLGERVERFERFDQLDRGRLTELLESCFGRRLASDYFATKRCHHVYVSERYRATAILTREGQLPYLDKFAVTPKAQGEGLGGSVWARIRRDHPRLFWRSRCDNPVNGWYFQQADGSYKSGRWTVFWYGLGRFDEAREAIEIALALPATFRDDAHG